MNTMITPLKKLSLHDMLNHPIMLDANILMFGITERISNKDYTFENVKKTFIDPLFNSCKTILIHKEVYNELDNEAKTYVNGFIGKNVQVVDEGNLYGKDPIYTTIFNNIANHALVGYERGRSKDRGEVYSLAYAAFHKIDYFCSQETMVDLIAEEITDLKDVEIITFDIVLLQAYVFYAQKNDNTHSKALKSIYKRHCKTVIKRHQLPDTLSEYIRECSNNGLL